VIGLDRNPQSGRLLGGGGNRLETEVDYGLPLGVRFVGTPRVRVSTSEYRRNYWLGYGVKVLNQSGLHLQLGVDAEGGDARESGRVGTSDLGLRLGLVEVRRGLDAVSGVDLTVRTEAAWAQLRTAAGDETVDGQSAAVNQARAGAEVSRPVRWDGGSLSPFGELHVRRDGGAGQTGTGLEVVAGNQLTAGRVRVDAQGRMLVLHSALGYRERSVGVTVGVSSRDREGLSLSVSPRWGDAATGGGALWQEQVYRRYHLPEAMGDQWALDARGEYGMRLSSGGLLTWFGSFSQSAYDRQLMVGGQFGMLSSGW